MPNFLDKRNDKCTQIKRLDEAKEEEKSPDDELAIDAAIQNDQRPRFLGFNTFSSKNYKNVGLPPFETFVHNPLVTTWFTRVLSSSTDGHPSAFKNNEQACYDIFEAILNYYIGFKEKQQFVIKLTAIYNALLNMAPPGPSSDTAPDLNPIYHALDLQEDNARIGVNLYKKEHLKNMVDIHPYICCTLLPIVIALVLAKEVGSKYELLTTAISEKKIEINLSGAEKNATVFFEHFKQCQAREKRKLEQQENGVKKPKNSHPSEQDHDKKTAGLI